ncbi:hypothetical protein GW17_00010678 [Ensete ventricosum]|nr:hypothetical protein GW17_00010678 [Ensete ventricosum]
MREPHDNIAEATRNRQHEQQSVLPATLNRLAENVRRTMRFRNGYRRIIESLCLDRLRHIVAAAVFRGEPGVVANVRAIADRDHSQRKLFIRGLGTETTTDSVRSLFSAYGEFEEAAVIVDRATGKSKGYGFITFRHADGALRPSDRLLAHFSSYEEIGEGPVGFDRQTGKFRGFALFAYKTAEGARNSLVDPNKNIDGHHLVCNVSIEGKKGKPGASVPGAVPVGGV